MSSTTTPMVIPPPPPSRDVFDYMRLGVMITFSAQIVHSDWFFVASNQKAPIWPDHRGFLHSRSDPPLFYKTTGLQLLFTLLPLINSCVLTPSAVECLLSSECPPSPPAVACLLSSECPPSPPAVVTSPRER